MRPLESKLLIAVAVGLVAAIVWPVFEKADARPRRGGCISNLKKLGFGLLMYSNEENDRFPPRDLWADATLRYAKNPDLLFDPALRKGADKGPYAYAFNGALSGAKPPKDPMTTPMMYDSVVPVRNASDLVTSLPAPGRHGGKNTIAYADGATKRVAR